MLLFIPFLFSVYEIRFMALPANVKYESELKLKAYRIERDGGSLALKPFMSSKSWHNFTKLGYSVHLIDQVSGNSVAGADEAESRHHDWRPALYDSNTNYSQLIQVDIPQDAPTNRAFWVVLTLWRERNRGYYRQKVLESDRRLLDDTQVVLGEMVLWAASVHTSTVPLATFDSGYALKKVDLPEYAQAGETLTIPIAWHTDKDGEEDHT